MMSPLAAGPAHPIRTSRGRTPSEPFGLKGFPPAPGSADAGLTKPEGGQDQAAQGERRPDDPSNGCLMPRVLVIEALVNAFQSPFYALQSLVVRIQPRIDRFPERADFGLGCLTEATDFRGQDLDIGLRRFPERADFGLGRLAEAWISAARIPTSAFVAYSTCRRCRCTGLLMPGIVTSHRSGRNGNPFPFPQSALRRGASGRWEPCVAPPSDAPDALFARPTN